jgi:hypothetical protein
MTAPSRPTLSPRARRSASLWDDWELEFGLHWFFYNGRGTAAAAPWTLLFCFCFWICNGRRIIVEIRPFVFDYIVIDVTLETCGVCVSFCVSLLLLSLCSEGRRREVSFCEFFFF